MDTGHGPGLYTNVHPKELENTNPSHIAVGLYGRSKKDRDGEEMRIMNVNQKMN